jgi:SAM-dependent methyltransferase
MDTPQFSLHAAIEQRHWWFLGRRAIMTKLVHHVLPPSKQALIADVGCGTGGNLKAFAQGYSCLGVDPSPEAIQLARQRFADVQFLCGPIPEVLNHIQQPVSLYLLMDVLEHVEDDFFLLSSILAAARPGAYLLLTVPADMRLWSPHDVSFGHYRRYDFQRFTRVWAGLPLTPLLVSYFNARLYPVARLIRMANRWRGRAAGTAGTDFRLEARPVNRLLQGVFAGESRVLVDLLEGRRAGGFPYGISLIALLRREHGTLHPRTKPRDVSPDPYDPTGPNMDSWPARLST